METGGNKINSDNIWTIANMVDILVKYGILIFTFMFSMVAKLYSIMVYKKRMRPWQCAVESTLCGMGSALTIYVLYSIHANVIVLCFIGGFSSLAINPIATVITKETTPILELAAKGIKGLIKRYFKNKE